MWFWRSKFVAQAYMYMYALEQKEGGLQIQMYTTEQSGYVTKIVSTLTHTLPRIARKSDTSWEDVAVH